MTKQELIDRVAARVSREGESELAKKTIALVVDAAFAELGAYFVKARVSAKKTPRFTYPGFGTFTKKERAARAGRDPRSGQVIEIPAKTTLGFQPGIDLSTELNRVERKGPLRKEPARADADSGRSAPSRVARRG